MIGADSLAIEIGKTLNLLSNPFKTNEKPYTVRPSIIFKSLASERTKKWTKSKRAAAICLSNYLYDSTYLKFENAHTREREPYGV